MPSDESPSRRAPWKIWSAVCDPIVAIVSFERSYSPRILSTGRLPTAAKRRRLRVAFPITAQLRARYFRIARGGLPGPLRLDSPGRFVRLEGGVFGNPGAGLEHARGAAVRLPRVEGLDEHVPVLVEGRLRDPSAGGHHEDRGVDDREVRPAQEGFNLVEVEVVRLGRHDLE